LSNSDSLIGGRAASFSFLTVALMFSSVIFGYDPSSGINCGSGRARAMS